MAVQLNHTIVWCRDKSRSAAFMADLFGLPDAKPFGPFRVLSLANDLSLDYHDTDDEIAAQHYAFLVSEDEFDEIFGRVQERSMPYWADPTRAGAGEINTRDGGRGVYFEDPDGHFLEILTRPYGSGA